MRVGVRGCSGCRRRARARLGQGACSLRAPYRCRPLDLAGLVSTRTQARPVAGARRPACRPTLFPKASFFLFRWRTAGISKLAMFMTLGLGLLSALLATAIFLIDVIFVAVMKSRIKNQSDGLVTGTWGDGVCIARSVILRALLIDVELCRSGWCWVLPSRCGARSSRHRWCFSKPEVLNGRPLAYVIALITKDGLYRKVY